MAQYPNMAKKQAALGPMAKLEKISKWSLDKSEPEMKCLQCPYFSKKNSMCYLDFCGICKVSVFPI